jgi:hypothetical protein
MDKQKLNKRKTKVNYKVVAFKVSLEDYKKLEQIKEIAKAKGLKLNKVLVFAMSSYFGLNEGSEQEQREEKKVEQKKEQKNEKSTTTFEQNLAVHEYKSKNFDRVLSQNLPSFFHENPWLTILSERK